MRSPIRQESTDQRKQKKESPEDTMNSFSLTVLIPTYRPGRELEELLRRLSRQKKIPDRVLILNTEEAYFPPRIIDQFRDRFPVLSVFHIEKSQFDHGGTRHLGMQFSDTDLVLCMTQDALQKDCYLTQRLTEVFRDPELGAAYGRQLAGKRSSMTERFTRQFNYPDRSRVKSADDLAELGIRTYFCSDVCAVWRRDAYFALGGFERHVIFNEDMILAGKMIQNGWKIAYCADAEVWHSHNYSGMQQLRRNFDLGVSQADHPEIFRDLPSEGAGLKLVTGTARWLVRQGHPEKIFSLIVMSGCKYAGYFLGRRYRSLPGALVRGLTASPSWWEQNRQG
jgi:rhamnosyltransferase